MQAFIAGLLTAGFIALCAYAYGKNPQHTHLTWANHNAAMLADVYGLTPDSVSEPIVLWRKVK